MRHVKLSDLPWISVHKRTPEPLKLSIRPFASTFETFHSFNGCDWYSSRYWVSLSNTLGYRRVAVTVYLSLIKIYFHWINDRLLGQRTFTYHGNLLTRPPFKLANHASRCGVIWAPLRVTLQMFGQSRITGTPFAILERNWEKHQQNKSKLQVEVLVLINQISLVLCRSQRWTNVWYLKSQHSLGQVIFRPLPDPELCWLARASL